MSTQDTDFTLHSRGLSLNLNAPVVMGILNVTPDSFHDGGKFVSVDDALRQALRMADEGASVIDIGGASTRPGAEQPSEEDEWRRVRPVIEKVREQLPRMIISIDTWRSGIAQRAVESGANIVNDISGGSMDENMFSVVAALGVPYVLMHMRGTPETMQLNPEYEDVVAAVKLFFENRLSELEQKGITQVILDPGFGFGKTVEHNFRLLNALDVFTGMKHPVLAGMSRKSMLTKLPGTGKREVLSATTAVNTIALQKGARMLRVHDVKEAMEAIRVFSYLQELC